MWRVKTTSFILKTMKLMGHSDQGDGASARVSDTGRGAAFRALAVSHCAQCSGGRGYMSPAPSGAF